MKKKYCKPTISFENFKMTTSVANTCSKYKGNSADESTRQITVTDNGWEVTLFSNNCANDVIGGNALCYHVMADGIDSVFGS